MAMDVKGTLIEVLKMESGVSKANKEWQKLNFVIETNDQYPKRICFQLFGDRTKLVDGIGIGSEVEVSFNLESKEFNGKYFTNADCWKINVTQAVSSGSGLIQKSEMQPAPTQTDAEGNDLPF